MTMYSDEDLHAAVGAGVMGEEIAAAFRAHVAQRRSAWAADEERFRLITGFNDLFVVIACLLLLASVAWIGGSVVAWLGAFAVATASWGLAEFFTRKRRMALPAIVLLLSFVASLFATIALLGEKSEQIFLAAWAVAGGGAWLHWWRFRVPITVAAGAATGIGWVAALIFALIPHAQDWILAMSLSAGIVVFALAMVWDGLDPLRQTRQSDVAFWLHLLAAPLLVHPFFAVMGVLNTPDAQTSVWQAVAVVVLYLVLALTSLCIDRRALMISALAYVLYTFSDLLKHYGVVSLGFALTALVIGSGLLLLSAFWHPARRFVLRFVPDRLRQRLVPCP
jgi:hypothetical protein